VALPTSPRGLNPADPATPSWPDSLREQYRHVNSGVPWNGK